MKNVDMRILTLKYWQEPKYKNILTNNVFKRTYEEIIEILEMSYWNDKRYSHLLSPNLFLRTPNEIKEIIELDYWNSNEFFYLLTPNIFHRTKDEIISLLKLPYWEEGKFKHLLTPSIFNKNANEIKNILSLSIWEKDNFYRGKVIRQMYGANLPENFPVVAIYENSMVTMIKSINHTTETYQKSQAFEKTIKKMIDELCRFEGASLGEINIRKKDFAQKRLLLVCPENEFTVTHSKSLENLMSYAASKLIVLDLRRYQKI